MNAIHARSQLRYWPTSWEGRTLILARRLAASSPGASRAQIRAIKPAGDDATKPALGGRFAGAGTWRSVSQGLRPSDSWSIPECSCRGDRGGRADGRRGALAPRPAVTNSDRYFFAPSVISSFLPFELGGAGMVISSTPSRNAAFA